MVDSNLSLWDDEGVDLPPRSRLFNLELAGIDGSNREALLGYMHRLAHEHVVPIHQLLKREVLSKTDIRAARFTASFSKTHSKTINGYGKYADQMSAALEELTLVGNLKDGTFLHWRGLFDGKGTGVLHPKRRWCANCLSESADAGTPIVHSLIWSAFVVAHCPIHMTPLRQCCPSCGSEQLFVSDASALGRCTQCGAFLGLREGLWDCPQPSERQRFMSECVADMISLGVSAASLASREVLVPRLKEFALATVSGGVRKLEREIGFRKHSICKWIEDGNRPQFDQFMEMCFRCGVPPVKLLDGTWSTSGQIPRIRKEAVPIRQQHKVLTPEQLENLIADIERLLQLDNEFEDAIVVAHRHGITFSAFKNRYGKLYEKVAAHRLRVRSKLHAERFARQEAAALEVIRQLHAARVRMIRPNVEAAMRSKGMTLKDPRLRAIAFAERARLEAEGYAPRE